MVSKNNRPLLREHSASQRVPHYGLRKLSFGVASVLLSTTFFLGTGQAVHADADTTKADTTEQNNETAQLAGTPSEATSQNVQSQPANSQAESSQAAQPANPVVASPSNYQSGNTYQQAENTASVNSGVGQGQLVKSRNSPSNSQVTTSTVASSQSTSINPVQHPTTTIKLPVAADHDSATLTVRFKGNKTGSTVAQTVLTGQLGQKIPIDKLSLPNGFSAIDQGWSKNLPVLSTGHLDVLIAPTGSAELQQAQQQLPQAQQQQRLAALFGTNLAVNNSVVTNVEDHSFGVDVSDYQGNDMQYYKNLGAKYAIIKVSEGTSSAGGSGAATKAANAKAAGMMVMAYYFSHAWGNTSTAQAEANYAVNRALADGIPVHSYIALDYETSFSGDKQANTNAAIAAMQVIRNANYLPLFYSSSSMMNNYFYTDQIVQRFPGSLWVAAYKYKGAMNEPDFGYFPSRNGVAIWQFTDSWKGANVDGDINVLPLQFLQVAPTTATVTVQYVDDDNGGQIAATRSKTANVNSTVKYSDFALPTNMHWVSGDGNSTINVGTANSTITLHVVHNTQNVSDRKEVTRTWKITDPSGASSSGTQSATFTRNGVKDLVTNQIKWGNWSSNQVLSAVKVPTVSGYTASGDIPQITVSEQTQPINVTITYTKNSQQTPSDQDNQAIIAEAQSYHPVNLVTKNVVNVAKQGIIGDGKTDVTNQLQNILNNVAKNGGGIVYLPKGNYFIRATASDPSWTNPQSLLTPAKLEGLQVGSNTTILLDKDATLSVIPNNFWNYLVLNVQGADNVNILGGTLNGDRLSHDMSNPNWTWNSGKGFNSPYYGEWGDGLSIQASNNTLVSGVKFKNFWGDGISLFPDKDQANAGSSSQAHNVRIANCVFDYNRRQGISVGHADNVEIDHSLFENTDGTGPAAGIDLEPGGGSTEQVTNVKIHDNVFLNNNNAGVTAYAAPKSKVSDVHVYNNTFINNGAWMSGQITFNNAENIEIDHNKFENDDASRFHSIWMMDTANDNIHDNYGRNSAIRIAKEAHGEGKVTNNYVSSVMIENTGYNVSNNHLPNEISSADLATMGANLNYQKDVDYPGLATNEKVTFHSFNSRGKSLNVTANPDDTVLNQSDPINWQADISFDIDGDLLTRKGDSDNTIRFAKPLFTLVHTPDDAQAIGESDLLADTKGVPLMINGVNCGQVYMNYIVPNGNFKGSEIQHVELKNIRFGDGRTYKAKQSGTKTLLTTADGHQYGYTYKNADGTLPNVNISDNQPKPKPSRPAVNDLSQKLINAAKSMLGYFDYDQVRPIKAALNGQDDTIKSLSDVDKNGKVDCSGFVWLAMKLAGEKVVRAQTGPWFTGSMASDATGAKNYLVQISPDQAQPGDIVIANLKTGTGDNGHTAVLNGYGVDYGWGSNTTANQILSTALPIVEMGGGKAHVNESTIKDAFSGLNQSGVQVIIARPVALADASDYAPDSYNIIVIDADNNNAQLSKQAVTTLPANYASYVPTNYTMSGYSLNGTTMTITVKHKAQGVSDSKTITRTVSIAEPNGQTKSAVQSITFNRTGTKDLVNGNISWGNWSDNGSYIFPSVTVPEIDNYTASGTVPDLTVTPDSKNSVVNITYTAKKPASSASSDSSAASSATTPSSSASSSSSSSADKPAASYHVQVVDVDDNNRTLKVSEVADNPTKEIDSFIPANYALKTYTLIGTQMVIEVTHQTKTTTDSRTVTRKITLTKPDGSTSSTTQSATISRQVVEDLVTHQSKPSPWSTSSWSAYRVPTILGYKPSQDSVPAVTVDGNTQNANINITYTAGTLTGTIDYIDPSGKLIKSTPWSGKVGSTIPINYVAPVGWRLVAGQTLPTSIIATTIVTALEVKIEHATTTVWPNAPKSTSDKLPDNADQTYPSGVGQNDLNKVITRTIEIVKPDGSTQSSQQAVKISRNATVDEVTKNVTYGNWSTGSFNAYDIPVISGYTASVTSIPAQTVDGNSTDETIRVTYKANAQPTKPSSDQPAHSQQPSQPSSSSASQSQSTSQTPSSNPSSSSSQAKPATSDTPISSQTSNAQSANQPASQVTSQSGSQAKPATSDTPSSSQASNAQLANQPSSQTTSQSSSQAKPASQASSSEQNSSAQPASQVPSFSQNSNAQLPSSNANQNNSTASSTQSSAITSQTVNDTSSAEGGLRNTAKPVSIKESPADQNNVLPHSYSTQGFSESPETSSISSMGNYQGTPQNASQSATGGSELPQTGNNSSDILALLGIGALGVVGAMSVSLKRERKF